MCKVLRPGGQKEDEQAERTVVAVCEERAAIEAETREGAQRQTINVSYYELQCERKRIRHRKKNRISCPQRIVSAAHERT